MKKKIAGTVLSLFILTVLIALGSVAYAEGTRDLVANGGYRPYTERYDATTLGKQRLSVMHFYANKGETVCLGTSVSNAKLYAVNGGKKSGWLFSNGAMGTSYSDAQLEYVNTADIYVAQGYYENISEAIAAGMTPGKSGVTLIDLPSSAGLSTPGFIYNSTQEKAGVDLSGTGSGYKVSTSAAADTSAAGYVPGVKTSANSFTAPQSGIYTVVFFSSSHSGDNPVKEKATDTTPFAKTQKGGTIASWDISVFKSGTLQTGRVFTDTLFLNMGGNVLSGGVSQGALYSDIYAVTDDGYQYKVDFNGMDPFGFVFFANSRGLLNTSGSTSSLYHGVRAGDNALSDVSSHGIALNIIPFSSTLDKTYDLFYEKPSADTLAALGIAADPTSGNGDIKGFAFTGTGSTSSDTGYVGKGGIFSFTASQDISATSYEIDLDFSAVNGGTVVLSNSLVKGALNSIYWDGKDANGRIVPAGQYSTINATVKLKGGEVHFPLLDVEQNPFGIKITRLNGADSGSSTVYFNNSASNSGDTSSPWTVSKNWQVGNETDASSGTDSSNGAMAFTNTHTRGNAKGKALLGDGDMSAMDIWAYYDRTVSLGAWSFSLTDTSFTLTKAWDRTGQTTANPVKITVKLQQSSDNGQTWSDVKTDAAGSAINGTVTFDTSVSSSYKWDHLDPSKTYQVKESPIIGYTASYSTVTGTAASGYSQTVSNKYKPTTLTLIKNWDMNGMNTTHPDSITFSVYTAKNKGGIHIGDFTLSGKATDSSWSRTISNIDPTLTYYVYETAASRYTGIDALQADYHITGEGKVSGNGNSGFTSCITDSFLTSNYMSVEVFKIWTDGDTYTAFRPSSIKVTLLKDGIPVKNDALGNAVSPVILSDANGWSYIWTALEKKDSADADRYSVKETDINGNELQGFAAAAENFVFLHNFGFGGIDNTYKTTSFTATKEWKDGTNTDVPTDVTMTLMQSTDGGKTYTDFGSSVTVSRAANKYTWTSLPSYTSDGTAILYKVYESPVSGYTSSYTAPGGTAGIRAVLAVSAASAYVIIRRRKTA